MKSFSDVYNEYFALSKYDLAKKMFEAGQQSKQAEVDELQKRIGKAVDHIEEWYGVVELSMIVDILKGDQS